MTVIWESGGPIALLKRNSDSVYSLFSFNSTLDFEWLLYVSAGLPKTIKEKKQFSPDKHRPMTLTTFLLVHIHSLN